MGTLLQFPALSLTRRDLHFIDPSPTAADFARELQSFRRLAEDTLSETLNRLEAALADIAAISRLLPPGEFKIQFDLDRRTLTTQLDLAKGKIDDLRAQTILQGLAPV